MSDRARVRFAPNVPQTLALAEITAELEEHAEWEAWVYQLADGRELAVSQDVAARINMLSLKPRDQFSIVKHCEDGAKARWDVWTGEKPKAAELARRATLVLHEPRIALVPARKDPRQIELWEESA